MTKLFKPTWNDGPVPIVGYYLEIDRKRTKLYCFDTGDLRYVKFFTTGWSLNAWDELDDVHFHVQINKKPNKEHLVWPQLKEQFKSDLPWTTLSIPVPKNESWRFFTKTYKRGFDVMIYRRDS